jgi:hypothetical protein
VWIKAGLLIPALLLLLLSACAPMRNGIVRVLLAALNSGWLNASPCRYGFIGNIDAFSCEHLDSEDHQRPGITVRQVLNEAERFRSCPTRQHGVTVIDEDGYRDANSHDLSDIKELK